MNRKLITSVTESWGISNIQFENVHSWDAPDFSDAYVAYCDIDGKPATDKELDDINEDSQTVYELLMEYLY